MKPNKFLVLIGLLFFGCFPPNTSMAQNGELQLDYTVTIEDPSTHILRVKLVVENINDSSLKIARQNLHEPNPTILSMTVKDDLGNPLDYDIEDTPEFEIFIIKSISTSSIIVEYAVDLEFIIFSGDHCYWNLDESYGAVEARIIILQPVDSAVNSCKVVPILPSGWKMISRLIDKGGYYEANIDDMSRGISYTPYNLVIWGPLVFGELDEYTRTIGGIEVTVAFYGCGDLQAKFSEYVFSIISCLSETIGPLNDPPNSNNPIKFLYVFLWETERIVHGLPHEFGQFTTINENSFPGSFTSDLTRVKMEAHIISHTWLIGANDADYLSDVLYVATWMGEGIVQFYTAESLETTGIWNPSLINTLIIGWFNNYENYILGTEYDVPIYPGEGWAGFPREIHHIMWYEKIPLVFRLLDWKIGDVTQGEKSFNDVWHYAHRYYPGNRVMNGISYNELLDICNYVTRYDFTNFFEKYISGNAPLPFYVEDDTLKIDPSEIPAPSPLTTPQLVRVALRLNSHGIDADGDGLADDLEKEIGTNVNQPDTDADGLSDREEFGAVIDGKGGEKLGPVLISDPQGDNWIDTFGVDIKDICANVFIDENSEGHLILVMTLWDDLYNLNTYLELDLFEDFPSYLRYVFDRGVSSLSDHRQDPPIPFPAGTADGKFTDRLEVSIPLDLINKEYIEIRGVIVHYEPSMRDADVTQPVSFQLQPTLYVTDPLNVDSDGDDSTDYDEYQHGTDPTDPSSFPGVPVILSLIPDSNTVQQGGTLGFQVSITNNTDKAGIIRFATKVTLPNGNPYPPSGYLFGPREVTLDPYQSKSGHLSHNIPMTAPLGTYAYHGYVGKPGLGVLDAVEFYFEVTAAQGIGGKEVWKTTMGPRLQ